MDIIFHFPPELIELLVDTIPLLFRSKKAVLLFFQGSGVCADLLDDLQQKTLVDREGISKYEIVRTTLARLNERGEASLRERREILKRVTEFEDFSTCWPGDQLKAKGLVAEIRRVVNVKDSFTRMNQEREVERKKRQNEQQIRINEQNRKRNELAQVRNDLFALFALPSSQSQSRGRLLEGVLNRLFRASGISIREAFELVGDEGEGVVEQIDGAIELDGHLYLVEMKWWKEPLGTADVAPHLVKVYGREGAGGIFISNPGYTDPAISTCRDALAHKVIVLCELQEIVMLLERQTALAELLKAKIQAAVVDRKPLFRPLS